MKYIKHISVVLLFLVLVSSCHKEVNLPVIESITLSSDLEEIHVGQQVHFSVLANTGENITSQSVFYRNTIETKDSLFSPTEVGIYEVYAKYKEIVSNTIKVKVNEKPVESIKIKSDNSEIILGKSFTFSVATDTGKDITSEAKVFVNGELYDSNTSFSPTEVGIYEVYAKYKEIVSNTIKVKVNEKPVESIKIESDNNEIVLGKAFIFSVVTDTGKDITSEVKVFVNGELYDGNTSFYPEATGDYVLYVTYEYKGKTLKSEEITVKVLSINATSFVKHPVVEGYTHSKCPWCPRLYYAVKKLDEVTDKVIFVSHHPINRSTWVEFLHSQESIPLWEDFKSKYKRYNSDNYKSHTVPNADIDRDMFWGKPQPEKLEEVTDRLNEKPLIGLALRLIKNEGQLDISVKTQFLGDSSEELKLTVYILENNLVHDYPNRTEYYDGENPVKDFVSNHVFRHSLTDIYGDDIPQEKSKKNKLYTRDFSVDIPNNITDKEKISVVAFVTSKNEKHIINARVITLGEEEQSFEGK